MYRVVGYAAWAFVAGGSIPVMAVLNARAARILSGPVPATVLLLAIGVAASVAITAFFRFPFPQISQLRGMPISLFAGGIIVPLYIISVTALTPRFGVANTVLFVVCAQIATAAAIDEWGLIGAPARPMTLLRMGGIAVAVVGVVISELGISSVRHVP